MVDVYEQLMTAIVEKNRDEVQRLLQNGMDLNARVDRGTSVLYCAILEGDEIIVRLMLEHGADPNLLADESAATIYTEKPLDLARQARFLMDWDKYDPIVKLLKAFGATDLEGRVDSESDSPVCEARARDWQAQKAAQSS